MSGSYSYAGRDSTEVRGVEFHGILEREKYIQEDFTLQLFVEDFTDTIQNEKLAKGLRCLTYRQRYAIELAFWKGYQYKEIAVILGCSPAAVTLLLQRAFRRLLRFLSE